MRMQSPRLLLKEDVGVIRSESWVPQPLSEHRSEYQNPEPRQGGSNLIGEVARAGLRGCGGGGYPVAKKWQTVIESGDRRVVVANGEEGEPGSAKDRYLMRRRPHLVLDGLLLARAAVGADRAIVYLSDAVSEARIAEAIAEREDAEGVEIFRVEHSYVAGEATSVVSAIDGGPAIPSAKPPRVAQSGVQGLPTLVQNVETLAHVAWISKHGARQFRRDGTVESPGTFMGTIVRPGRGSVLFERPYGVTLGAVLNLSGAASPGVSAVLLGGCFGGLVPQSSLDLKCDFESMALAGRSLGSGTVTLLGSKECPVAAAAVVLEFFANSSSRQCGACLRGTEGMALACRRLVDGSADAIDVGNLERWGASLIGRGACALLDGAATCAATLLSLFPASIQDHLEGSCRSCAKGNGWDSTSIKTNLVEHLEFAITQGDQGEAVA